MTARQKCSEVLELKVLEQLTLGERSLEFELSAAPVAGSLSQEVNL